MDHPPYRRRELLDVASSIIAAGLESAFEKTGYYVFPEKKKQNRLSGRPLPCPQFWNCVPRGSARQLEGLSSPFARDLSRGHLPLPPLLKSGRLEVAIQFQGFRAYRIPSGTKIVVLPVDIGPASAPTRLVADISSIGNLVFHSNEDGDRMRH
jgi:hypothetical protein